MNNDHSRVVLITGASSGIGRACAEHLGQQGYRVYGTSRQADREAGNFELIQMDVNNADSVRRGVENILSREGQLDVVVNNAGFGIAGAVEDTSLAEARSQFETNFFGVMRVCRAVLPVMRQQRQGYIVNISSIGGIISIPFQALYCASKFALEGFTEALRAEMRSYGIRVVLIEPGDFHTNFTVHRRRVALAKQDTPYQDKFIKALEVMESDETSGPGPERIAFLLDRIINTPRPRLRYLIGPASQRIAVRLKKVLPSRIFEWLIMKNYKVL